DEEKKYYTLVLKGHLDLAAAVFLHGTAGNNLDILARRPMWNIGIDYQCGTGHGVGHVLGVHEGPHGIRNFLPTAARPSHILEPGMIVTDEPGIYIPHKVGIRIENELLTVKNTKNFYGQFMNFENLTFCPYEAEAIDPQYLEQCEIDQLNAYHQMVYEKIGPKLTGREKTWLRKVTRPITK
ncbi:MAG: M24 family metallopeptidase, partial [Erysipelotrichia bacterium]|nr:M24 family metallopeptidase [Erysipelotrichia bacterium]